MVGQRDQSVQLQTSKRESAIKRLIDGLSLGPEFGVFAISIGPRIGQSLLTSAAELRKWIDKIRSEGRFPDRNSAIDNGAATGLHNGIAWISPRGRSALQLDGFGNVTMVECVIDEWSEGKFCPHFRELHGTRLKRRNGNILLAHAGMVASRVLACMSLSRRLLEHLTFGGDLEARIVSRNTRHIPLVVNLNMGLGPIGGLPLDENIDFTSAADDVMAGEDDATLNSFGILGQLGWAWGWVSPNAGVELAHAGEQYLGVVGGRCETCKQREIRRDRKQCIFCIASGKPVAEPIM